MELEANPPRIIQAFKHSVWDKIDAALVNILQVIMYNFLFLLQISIHSNRGPLTNVMYSK